MSRKCFFTLKIAPLVFHSILFSSLVNYIKEKKVAKQSYVFPLLALLALVGINVIANNVLYPSKVPIAFIVGGMLFYYTPGITMAIFKPFIHAVYRKQKILNVNIF